MEVELERGNEGWVYAIKRLLPGGLLVKLKVKARDGTIVPHRDHGAKIER